MGTAKQSSTLRKQFLEEQWERDHNIILHGEQAKLQIDRAAVSKIDGRTLCARLGTCVCQRPAVLLFCKRLFEHMKGFFKKIGKTMTYERALLEGGQVILQFWSNDAEAEPIFFHVGFMNYVTWHFSGMLLHFEDFDEQNQVILLTVGNMHDEEDGPLRWLHLVQTVFEFVSQSLDLSLAWSVQYLNILSDDDVVPADRMMARFVEASVINDNKEHQLWKGWGQEQPKPRRQVQRSQGAARSSTDVASRPRKRMRRNANVNSEPGGIQQEQEFDMDADDLIQEFLNQEALDCDENNDDNEEEEDIEDALAKLLQEADEADCPSAGPDQAQADVEVEVQQGDDDVISMPHIPDHLVAVEPVPDALELLLQEDDQNQNAADADARRAPAAPGSGALHRAAKVSEDVLDIPTLGEIRYNERQFFRAHCPVHGPDCRRQRQSVAGKRAGAGRPLGALAAWLEDANAYRTAAEHIASKTATYNRRQAARALLKATPGADRFLAYERAYAATDLGDGEEPLRFT